IAALVYGFIRAAADGWSDGLTLGALGAGVLLLGVFAVVETRTKQPLMPLRLFANRDRATGYVAFLLGAAAMMSMFFFLTQFLQDVRGFGALATGFAFLPMAAGMFGMTRIVPRALPRFGPRPLVITGLVIMLSGLVWLTQLTPASGYWSGLFGPMALMGIGGGLSFVPITPTVMGSVPPRDAGAAGGVLQTMQQTGATLGLAVLVTVFGTAYRHAGGPAGGSAALVHAMTTAFTVSAVIAVAALVNAFFFASTRKQPA
ncbi:MAG: MFS transporter, partial [Streptomycetaceae bacterium]|nr:MFS transporter [Streptomycetaceae bacterium]